jgi:hypothetical protein
MMLSALSFLFAQSDQDKGTKNPGDFLKDAMEYNEIVEKSCRFVDHVPSFTMYIKVSGLRRLVSSPLIFNESFESIKYHS